MADIAPKIRKQVEFYFSDSNLPFDKYLWTLTQKNSEGWVPLATIANFKKMQMLTKDMPAVVAAIREEPSELVELDEAGENIRRKAPLVEQNFTARSIYAKGFPLVDESADNAQQSLLELQDKIDEFFSEHGKVLAVRLRKTDAKPSKFKGSVFVEFGSPEEAEAVVSKSLQYDGTDLLLKTKKAYLDEKSEKYKDAPPSEFKKRKFNAFKSNFRTENRKQHKDKRNDKQQRGKSNYRLMTFAGAQGLDADAIKEIVGKEDVGSVTLNEDGSGYIELNKGTSKDKTMELRKKPEEDVKNINFRFAGAQESEKYAELQKSEPQVGEKRKAEDEQ